MNKTEKEIITDRLILREIQISDTDYIVKWRTSPSVYKYFKDPHRITTKEHLDWFNTSYDKNDSRIDWICIEKSSNNRIGVFGITKDKSKSEVEVSYLLDESVQGNGYAGEAVNALIDYVKNKWKMSQFIATIHKDNILSIEFIKKMGFELTDTEGDFEIFRMELKD